MDGIREFGIPTETTWGHITKTDREMMGLPKTHSFDAVAIATGGREVQVLDGYIRGRCVPDGCYKLFTGKGSHVANQVNRDLWAFVALIRFWCPMGERALCGHVEKGASSPSARPMARY